MHRALAGMGEAGETEPTMKRVFARYRAEILPRKAASTGKMQARQLAALEKAFGGMDAEDIRPHFVAEFHDLRGRMAPVSANRELALLSHVMRLAIRMGMVRAGVNPCSSIERHKEKPRDRYIEHDEYNAVWQKAPPALRVLMDMAYLTGQRQADLIKLRKSQLKADGIHFTQGKTGRRLVIGYSDNLRHVLGAADALSDRLSVFVVVKGNGTPYTSHGIQTAWQRLMRACIADGTLAERFTFHDIRAKAATDDDDGRLLGHMSPQMLRKVYRRKPEKFAPVW